MYMVRLKTVCICIIVGKAGGSPSSAFNGERGSWSHQHFSWPLQVPPNACHEDIEGVCVSFYIGLARTDDKHTIVVNVAYRQHWSFGCKEIYITLLSLVGYSTCDPEFTDTYHKYTDTRI